MWAITNGLRLVNSVLAVIGPFNEPPAIERHENADKASFGRGGGRRNIFSQPRSSRGVASMHLSPIYHSGRDEVTRDHIYGERFHHSRMHEWRSS